jgi:hypothetical protein
MPSVTLLPWSRSPGSCCGCTIIAGTRGAPGGSAFGAEPNDSVVAVGETLISSSDLPFTFPVRHTFMMNDAGVRALILRILEAPAG